MVTHFATHVMRSPSWAFQVARRAGRPAVSAVYSPLAAPARLPTTYGPVLDERPLPPLNPLRRGGTTLVLPIVRQERREV